MDRTRPTSADAATSAEPPAPTGWKGYLLGIGPGLVVAMSWLGTGDLIDSSVAGANYGYTLMWAMALALITKYFYGSALAKYQLCNRFGDETVLAGFRRLWRWYPLVLGVGAVITGFILQTYMARGLGTSLYHLSGGLGDEQWGIFLWTAVGVALTIALALSRRQYRILEIIARLTVTILIATFVTTALVQGVDVGGIVGGLAFALPQDQGLFSSLLIAVALIGAVGSSVGTLLYAEFVRDKGWRGPRFLKLQRLDLAVGLCATLVINLAIWTVGAETFGGTGRTVEHESDLVDMMRLAIGGFGPLLLWVAFFFITFSSFPAFGRGYATLLVGGIHASLEERGRRYGSVEKDPIFRWVQLVLLYAVPVLFALPMFSNLVLFTVAGSSMAALLAPLVIAGIIVLTSRRRFMHDGYANRWWEIVVLILVGCFALWASWAVLSGLGDLLSS